MTIITKSEAETVSTGRELGKKLRPSAVVALSGGLGAGKTVFTRGLAEGLSLTGLVTSPTFTIVNEYLDGETALFHFDMYRIENEDALYDIGWDDYLTRGGVCVVEWSENVMGALPPDTVFVDISILDGDTRRLEIYMTGEGDIRADTRL